MEAEGVKTVWRLLTRSDVVTSPRLLWFAPPPLHDVRGSSLTGNGADGALKPSEFMKHGESSENTWSGSGSSPLPAVSLHIVIEFFIFRLEFCELPSLLSANHIEKSVLRQVCLGHLQMSSVEVSGLHLLSQTASWEMNFIVVVNFRFAESDILRQFSTAEG